MAKQRAAQKKNADKAAMMDELRARRYQEQKERDARAREQMEVRDGRSPTCRCAAVGCATGSEHCAACSLAAHV